jgi:hypothetical protein
MLKDINSDKQEVNKICHQSCVTMWLAAAEVCQLTYACPYNPDKRLLCRRPADIGLAWKQCSDPDNCKRIAFIFNYYASELYERALGGTHQNIITNHIMKTLGIEMDVQPTEMRGGQMTCIQQQYSICAKNMKNNILRAGGNKHNVRVNLEQGKARTNKNLKRPKEVFYNWRKDLDIQGGRSVERVSTNRNVIVC